MMILAVRRKELGMAKISATVLCVCVIALIACASAHAYVGTKGTLQTFSGGPCIGGACPPQGYMGGAPPVIYPQYGAPPPYPRRITKCKPPAMGGCPPGPYPQGPVQCAPMGCPPPTCGAPSYPVPACGPMGCPPPCKLPVRWY